MSAPLLYNGALFNRQFSSKCDVVNYCFMGRDVVDLCLLFCCLVDCCPVIRDVVDCCLVFSCLVDYCPVIHEVVDYCFVVRFGAAIVVFFFSMFSTFSVVSCMVN